MKPTMRESVSFLAKTSTVNRVASGSRSAVRFELFRSDCIKQRSGPNHKADVLSVHDVAAHMDWSRGRLDAALRLLTGIFGYVSAELDPSAYGAHSLRRTKATLIYHRAGNIARSSCCLDTPSWKAPSDTWALR